MRRARRSGDDRLVARAATTIAVQTGVAVALVVALVVAIVYTLGVRARLDATEHKVRDKVENAETSGLADAPLVADGLPDGCSEADLAAATAELDDGIHRIDVCGVPFLVYVGAHDDGRRLVAATSFVEQEEETQRVAWLSLLAGMVGVLAASGVGWAVGRRAVRPLAGALTSQRRFVADASHELRTPLTVLLTRAQILARSPDPDPRRSAELNQLVDDARALGDVITDMLLSAELQHGHQPHQDVDLAEVAAQVRRSFATSAEQRGVDLVLDVEPGRAYFLQGVPTALRRAVAALVDNALAHVQSGGTVSIGLEKTRGAVVLRVTDDGEGFEPALADDLRSRFGRAKRAAAASEHAAGLRVGLGLALVEEVVRAHGGRLDLHGRPGEGATVSLIFEVQSRQSASARS